MRRIVERLCTASEHHETAHHNHIRRCRLHLALFGLTLVLCRPAIGDESKQAGLHPLFHLGLTMGGDQVVRIDYENTDKMQRVRAGGFYQFGLGAQFRVSRLSLSLTANYHFDNAPGSDGFGEFERFPVEAIAYFHPSDDWRIGGGVRRSFAPRAEARNREDKTFQRIDFYDATGSVIEIGYAASEHTWLNLRYVREEYEPKTWTDNEIGAWDITGARPFDGSHFGINFTYVF